jgi:hypothetical protein
MARKNYCRIYIKKDDTLFDFMWAIRTPDGSIIIGFRFPGTGEAELISDPKLGELRQPDVFTVTGEDELKISFHSSGIYKLTTKAGTDHTSIDRLTVIGSKLQSIIKPRRMSEILLPHAMPQAKKKITKNDIALDATTAPPGPLRCLIHCMSKQNFNIMEEKNIPSTTTSIWEYYSALESESHVWVWTLRRSANDSTYPNNYKVCVFGNVKLGRPISADELIVETETPSDIL